MLTKQGYFRGSMWFFCQGVHRDILRAPNNTPLRIPYLMIASFVYSEQEG